MNGRRLVAALGARRSGDGWIARCPAHDDHTPSLAIRVAPDGKVLVHCHAGCGQARVIAALRARGWWGRLVGSFAVAGDVARAPRDRSTRVRVAARIWRSAIPADGTPAQAYLHGRGLTLPIPRSLRFHPALRHQGGSRHPAMVALITHGRSGRSRAIHRTFLAPDGAGKANVSPQRLTLGPSRGAAVRLAPATDRLMVGEGIETCLAAMQASGLPAWAALSAAGLGALEFPEPIREVIVLADGDEPGEAAARAAARRWQREGRNVRIARAPRGLDFNDVLIGRGTT